MYRRRHIHERDVREAQTLLRPDMSPHEQSKTLFDAYVKVRTARLPLELKNHITGIIDRLVVVEQNEESWMSGFYMRAPRSVISWIFREKDKIIIVGPSRLMGSPAFYRVLAHELEHVIQSYVFNNRLLIEGDYEAKTPAHLKYAREFGAIRGEWEFWRLLTQELKHHAEQLALQTPKPKQQFLELRALNGPFSEFRSVHPYHSLDAVVDFYNAQEIPVIR